MNRLQVSSVIFILIYISMRVECAKILCVFAAPCLSHQIVFRRFTAELHKRGHELVIVTPMPEHPNEIVKNLTEIDVSDSTSSTWKKFTDTLSSNTKRDLNQQKKEMATVASDICYAQIIDKRIQDLINNEDNKFDLIIGESGCKHLLILPHIFKTPVILISSLGAQSGNFEAFGGTVHPLLYPPGMCRRFYNINFWQEMNEIYDYYWYNNLIMNQESLENEMLKKRFGDNTPILHELFNNLDKLFLNIHRIWEGNRPVPPSVLYFGGMHQVPEKSLTQDLKSYLDASKKGVIYMSFGTNVVPSLFKPEKLQIFIDVFAKLSYNIIWKWDQDDIPGISENVKVMKWTPQADLLRHPKIKLFITQGGQQSTDESITAGVPFIGIPMLGDQWYTTEKYVQFKIGIKLDFDTLTEEQFKQSIETVIEDASYRENVVKLRTILYDQPQTSLERAVWWTEYVLRHGGAKHLRGPAANMSWTEYVELEILLTLLFALFVIIALSAYILYLLPRFMHKFLLKLNVIYYVRIWICKFILNKY